ncbi:fibronectin type III domain-containing protein [Flavobacterium wongokense]|uniref:fibronectin type III domain-containing protein n=1 Tax=Flavobacterium wongokense TaxID=2910674 RepID=UPI001F24D1DF|nr:fibronectin type III domain-containing protein [Flavobacterium sp. WG47]MCF6130855.1 fibronectin type III domain-containing protein [Flavobacterium sp. WG47]
MKKNYIAKKPIQLIANPEKTEVFSRLIFLLLTLLSFNAFGQGTTCATATPVTINGTCITAQTMTDSTADLPALSSCATGTFRVEGWYTFTVTGGPMLVTISAEGNAKNIFLQLISETSTCTGLTQIACANATTTNGTQVETISAISLNNGTYYIKVVNVGSGGTMLMNYLCVTSSVANDNCSGAIGLTVNPSSTCTTSTNGTTVGATQSQAGCSGTADDDVWYSFVATATSHVITVTPGTLNNAVFEVFPGNTCGALGTGVCVNNTNGANVETASITGFTAGLTYYVRVYSQGNSTNVGTFSICVTSPPANNQCANATSLPCGTTNLAGSTIGTSSYTHGSGCTMSNYGVWYTFVGDGNQNVISATTTAFDIEMSISRGSCGSLINVACVDSALSSGTETYTFNTTLGTTYYVYIAHWDSTSTTIGNFTISRACVAPLTNDECSGAIALTVGSTCNYTTYTNSGATGSSGMTAPGCANFLGSDVWFSVVVPATGEIDVDLQTGVMTDSGIALYSGTCGALTLLDCDDDSSANGLMSFLQRTGLTPGQTIYIRVWEYGNDNNGTFGICVSTPSCPSPADLFANILSNTSVTVNWTASSPPASGGYQYYINTTGVAPTNATPPTGSTAAGVIGVTLTGLTPGLKYYFWVRSYCGGSDTSTWFGPTNYTPCNVGTGLGTTSLTCPSIDAGGLGLSGSNPAPLNCSALTCVDLEATYLQLNQPTSYSVASIPYTEKPYQYTCLQNPVSVNVDDIWSPMINLPFNFCFYGNNYNKCLIGSNGVITFDTTTYSPGGYNAWSFSNSLPNASLFRNTIFGVYHDIDPSKGGQVGYELITLNTGCRALVASWNDIPMYSSSCNSILYTGMIVLYENTNVIDVFIKEKNVCSTWNGGNAIVGLQNAAGNAAVVAPNRNGLDADWTVTNEGWRFTPTGSSLTTIKWFEGNGTTGTQLGTAATLNVCPTVTTTYTAEVTYALCSGTNLKYTDNVVVTVNGNKIWNGSQNSDWNTANNWTPSGVPTNTNCVVVPITANNPVISAAPDGVGYNLAVYNGAQLTVNSNNNLTITDKVTVQPTGVFTLNNSASLIQINNILNSGSITYKRTSPSVRTLDYVYWSSPVSGFNVNNIVSPYSFGAVYLWNTTVANANGGQGNWQSAAGNTMIAGKGYIARAPGTSPFNNSTTNPLNGTFTGVPNNGNITIALERGSDQNTAPHTGTNGTQLTNLSDNWNLLGNPYPSAIRGSQFLFDNNTKVEGNIRLWTHGTLPSVITPSPFYGSYLSNYTPGDYLTYNFTGTSCCPTAGSDLFIGAGQGFFVQMVDGPPVAAAANITVAFNNNLRSATYSNSTFYKTQNMTTSSTTDVNNIERNRIWLDLINSNSQTDRILFGYIENATMGRDSFYDCITQNTGASMIYSMVDDTKFAIQGRALPFDVNDEVPIGFNAPTQGNYTIGIAAVDGLFDSQNIYLKDNLLNITHNLKADPYIFTTQSGEINDRFKVVYIDNALGIDTHPFNQNDIKVMVTNEVAVSSSNLIMESIEVYNVLGQKLETFNNISSNYVILSNLRKNNTTLFLKIKLQTGETVTKKIIY